jgi:HD-GYP domain-containing protein (c-di-GMP phosphodiesterase class II)
MIPPSTLIPTLGQHRPGTADLDTGAACASLPSEPMALDHNESNSNQAMLARRHGETFKHLCRVSYWAGALARECPTNGFSALNLSWASLFHDVGKLAIPHEILDKPNRLTAAEFAIAQLHTLKGARLLSRARVPLFQLACKIALCHHENWNGSGYPFGLAGSAIPLGARIVAVADIYDALRCDRPYRSALPEREVRAIMRDEQGRKLDPDLCTAFLELLRRRSRTVFLCSGLCQLEHSPLSLHLPDIKSHALGNRKVLICPQTPRSNSESFKSAA